jgi:MFS family permease
MLLGVYMAAQALYRFAAADVASPAFRPKAISWVMAGGLASAVLGPEIVVRFKDVLEPVPYAGGYLAMVALNLVGVVPMLFLDLPRPPRRPRGERAGRPWSEILADRRVPVAMLCAMVSYSMMNLVMTSTPLAMIDCGFVTDDAAHVVRVHVIAMYAPSFFTGALIARFGAPRIIALGLALLAGCGVVAIAGITLPHFWVALSLLGLGWNFGFIGATALLAGAHRPEERARVQGMNDFLVFGLVTVGSFSSGALMAALGWVAVNLSMVPPLVLAGAALGWLVLGRRSRPI